MVVDSKENKYTTAFDYFLTLLLGFFCGAFFGSIIITFLF
jgi:hypothetical protein